MTLERRTPLGPGEKSRERGSTFATPRSPLDRKGSLAGRNRRSRRAPISPASTAQRNKVKFAACIVCGRDGYEAKIDPAHIVPRGLGGCDHEDCVIPLCRAHHQAYDDGRLDLLPHLEPRLRTELGHAVEHLGLIAALERITNTRWQEAQAA